MSKNEAESSFDQSVNMDGGQRKSNTSNIFAKPRTQKSNISSAEERKLYKEIEKSDEEFDKKC